MVRMPIVFMTMARQDPVFPHDSPRSGIPTIPEGKDNSLIAAFRRRIERIYIFSPDPRRMRAESGAEVARPDRELHQLASWLRHLSQESIDAVNDIQTALKGGVLEGFVGFKLAKTGETSRVLKFDFRYDDDAATTAAPKFSLNFDQLSDGQRNLVALFTVLHSAVGADTTLCLDEPDNYVALREIQPWLIELIDRTRETAATVLLDLSSSPRLSTTSRRLRVFGSFATIRALSGRSRSRPPKTTGSSQPRSLLEAGSENLSRDQGSLPDSFI